GPPGRARRRRGGGRRAGGSRPGPSSCAQPTPSPGGGIPRLPSEAEGIVRAILADPADRAGEGGLATGLFPAALAQAHHGGRVDDEAVLASLRRRLVGIHDEVELGPRL